MKHYWNVPQDEAMVATLLDPRCKSLSFASESQRTRAKNILREKAEEAKQDLGAVGAVQSQSPNNPLLRSIFTNRYRSERRSEVDEYLMIEEIGLATDPFKW